jgi:DNA-directed RNA polymerase specialized sigma24 family protein
MDKCDPVDPSRITSAYRAALSGDEASWRLLERKLRRTAARIAQNLGVAYRERESFIDVVSQEVALALLEGGPDGFDERRGSLTTYVWQITRRRASAYLSALPAVGRRRPCKSSGRTNGEFPRIRELDDEVAESLAAPRSSSPSIRVDTQHDAAVLLAKAPPIVAHALRAMHRDGLSLGEIAEGLNVNRLTLRRRMDTFCRRMCEAAAA